MMGCVIWKYIHSVHDEVFLEGMTECPYVCTPMSSKVISKDTINTQGPQWALISNTKPMVSKSMMHFYKK
jgi:hypothetical protein